MELINWLQEWYKSNCDGYWEHQYGIEIGTIDNPGWYVKIDLKNTSLEKKIFQQIKIDLGDEDWYVCRVHDGVFDGCGDPHKLHKILSAFKNWADSNA